MTIKEVSLKFELSPDTLRYYEKAGLIDPVPKTKSGIRDYREQDLNRIEFIKCMREAGIPIEVLKQYLELYQKGEETLEERKKLLSDQREILGNKLKAYQQAYERLTFKIKLCEQNLLDENLNKNKKIG